MSQRDGTAFARGRDPGEVVRAGMRELAGPHLYRQNAFRLTGLPATVDRTGARRRQQQLVAALKLGADVDELGSSRDPDAVRAAFDVLLGDPRRRLVHEVFAAWGEPDGCECPALVHQQHDTAVTAHAEAIDIDPDELLAATMAGELPAAWDLAAGSWSRTVRSASFWRHLRHRVERLDDRQLDVSAVDVLKGELPKLLVKPLLALAASARYPAPLRKGIDDWPVSRADADWLLEEAAEPLYEELESLVGDLHARADSDDPDEVVAMVREAVNPALARLEGLIPRDGSRRTAVLCNRTAVVLNNCAFRRFLDDGKYDNTVQAWLSQADALATDPMTEETIDTNRQGMRRAERELNDVWALALKLQRLKGRWAAEQFLRRILDDMSDDDPRGAVQRMLADLGGGATGDTRTGDDTTVRVGYAVIAVAVVVVAMLVFCFLLQVDR
jgi:hypothetical protein